VKGAPLKVLVVDDNRSAADAMARMLAKGGDDVLAVYDGGSAIERIRANRPDVVLTDLKMEPVDGMAVLSAAREQRPPVEVIVFTAYGDVEVAVEAMRLGARDFLTKPVPFEQVASRLDQVRSYTPGSLAARALPSPEAHIQFIARSAAARSLLDTLKRAADVPSPVWIEGELGAGRGHAAMALHHMGDTRKPFRIRDVARDEPWPESGTVLIPNVDELPEDLQRRLYRSLQHAPPSLRLVATSSPNARRHVAEGSLRPELFYALSVIVVRMPPLRERTDDIVPMMDQALEMFAQRYNRIKPKLSEDQMHRLRAHSWPGNVRELVNLAERAIVLGGQELNIDAVVSTATGMPALEPGFDLAAYLEGIERGILMEALRVADGDRNQAGRILGVERNTLRYKLNKYGLLDKG
jgi:DNA-binding NtrC family response regulator